MAFVVRIQIRRNRHRKVRQPNNQLSKTWITQKRTLHPRATAPNSRIIPAYRIGHHPFQPIHPTTQYHHCQRIHHLQAIQICQHYQPPPQPAPQLLFGHQLQNRPPPSPHTNRQHGQQNHRRRPQLRLRRRTSLVAPKTATRTRSGSLAGTMPT